MYIIQFHSFQKSIKEYKLLKEKCCILMISEIGNNLKIKELYFTTTQISGFMKMPAHVLTLEDTLFICLGFTEPLLAPETARNICEQLLQILQNLAEAT